MTPQRKDLKYPAVSELRGIQLKKTFALDLNMHVYSGIYSVVIKYHDTPRGVHTIGTAAPNTIAYVCKQLCVLYFFSRFNEWIWATSAFEIFSDAVFKGRCTVQSSAASQVCRAQRIWSGIACSLRPHVIVPFDWRVCVCGCVNRCLCVWVCSVCVRTLVLYLLEWLVTEVLTA